jgi:hypothetical protein
MYNDLANIVIGFLSFLGCKVTTIFLKLYQLPMEKMQKKEIRKLLQISGLWKSAHNTLWKILIDGMEKRACLPEKCPDSMLGSMVGWMVGLRKQTYHRQALCLSGFQAAMVGC